MLHCCTLPRVGAGFIPALPIADKIQSKKTAAAGFIPVLPTEDKIQSKCPAAARVGINPTPTAVDCCKRLSISGIAHIRRRDGVYPRPTNSEQDTKQMPRSSEGGDKTRPFGGGRVQHNVSKCRDTAVEYRATLQNAAIRRLNAIQRCILL